MARVSFVGVVAVIAGCTAATGAAPAQAPAGEAGQTEAPDGSRKDALTALIKANRAGFRACFDAWSKDHPGVWGTVVLVLHLNGKGDLEKVETMTSGFASPEVEECIVAHARTLSYPPLASGKSSRFSYPFDFKPLPR